MREMYILTEFHGYLCQYWLFVTLFLQGKEQPVKEDTKPVAPSTTPKLSQLLPVTPSHAVWYIVCNCN